MNKLIVIMGDKRSGKDVTAKYLQNHLENLYTVDISAFATLLCTMVQEDTGLKTSNFTDEYKDTEIVYSKHGFNLKITPRKILEAYQTLYKDLYGNSVFAKHVLETAAKPQYTDKITIIPDLRFVSELDTILELKDNFDAIHFISTHSELSPSTQYELHHINKKLENLDVPVHSIDIVIFGYYLNNISTNLRFVLG